MYAIYGTHNDSVGLLIAGYFNRNTGYPTTGPFFAIGWIDKKGEMVGQAIFNDYTEANIEIHIYGPRCITKKTIKDVYDYVFTKLKCERLTAKPYCTNKTLLRLLTRMGFVYEFTQEAYYKHDGQVIDADVYKLTKNNIPRWIYA